MDCEKKRESLLKQISWGYDQYARIPYTLLVKVPGYDSKGILLAGLVIPRNAGTPCDAYRDLGSWTFDSRLGVVLSEKHKHCCIIMP